MKCYHCGGETIPPTPGRPEEMGHYCEGCGATTGDDGKSYVPTHWQSTSSDGEVAVRISVPKLPRGDQ